MELTYGISFVGFRAELVTKLFKTQVDSVQKMVLISTKNEKAKKAIQEVESFLKLIGVKSETVVVADIFDFFEVSFLFERLYSLYGKPKWINISAGPSSGISALSISATLHDIPLVSYDLERDQAIVTDIKKLWKLKKYKNKYIRILDYLRPGPQRLKDLSNHFGISKSAMSRRLRTLIDLKVVKTKGVGRGSSVMTYELTSLGEVIVYPQPLSLAVESP